jgi:serine-threonine kinase receptor-associated protein
LLASNLFYNSPVTPDGFFLTSASKDGQPMLRNGSTGDWIGTFQGHKGAVWACILNDTAFVAATASADFTARVWNAVTGDEVHQFPHKHIVRTAAFERGPTATRLLTGGAEKLIRIFDLARPEAPPQILPQAHDNIRCTAWAHDNTVLLVSYLDKPNIDIWDVRSGSGVVKTLETKGTVTSIEVGEGDRWIVTADGSNVDFRDGASFDLKKQHSVTEYEVETASYCPERGRFVAAGTDMWVHLHDFETGAEVESGRGHHGPVHCVRFAPGGETYASGSEDGTIRIWRTEFVNQSSQGGAAVNGAVATTAATS